MRILGNKFYGPGEILIRLIGQASNTAHGFVFMFNNVTSQGGIRVENAWSGSISYNNIELYEGATGSNGAVIDLAGNAALPPENFEVRGNYIGGGPDVPNSIRVDLMKFTRIEANMLPRGTGKTVVITPNGDRTQIVRNREQPYGELIGTWLDHGGTNTCVEYIHPNTGSLIITSPMELSAARIEDSVLVNPQIGDASASSLRIGGGVSIANTNEVVQYMGEIVTTAATSDSVSDSRFRNGSHCMAVPLNPTAAAMTGVYAAAGNGVVSLMHPPVAGATFAIFASVV